MCPNHQLQCERSLLQSFASICVVHVLDPKREKFKVGTGKEGTGGF